MYKCILTLTAIFLLCSPGHAQQKKPITHEAMWLLKRVGAPAVSPDGCWAIFSVTEPAYDEKEQVNDIWIVPMDGAKPARRLTSAKAGESGYTWSPDGGQIAFVAKRDGEENAQIYLLNMREGGEAQKLTKLCTGASAPQWSPDGKKIMFQSSVFPLCYADSLNKKAIEDRKKIKYKARVYEGFPIRNWDTWIEEKQTHLYVQDLHPDSSARNLLEGVAASKEQGFRFGSANWAKDGQEIVMELSTDAHTAAYQNTSSQLYKLSVNGGKAQQITKGARSYERPFFSPNGRYLLCYSTIAQAQEVFSLQQLTRFDYPALTNETLLTQQLDRAVTSVIVEGDQLYMSVEDQGRDKLFTMPLAATADTSMAKLLGQNPRGCLNRLSNATLVPGVWAANYESAMAPPEIVRVQPDGTIKPLTNFNRDSLATLDLGAVEEIWFTSSRGKRIRSLLVKPAGFDASKKYPLLTLMHGGPASSFQDLWSFRWNHHLLAAPGHVILMTDYTGSTGYGEAYARAIKGDPFRGPAEEINEAAADAIKRFPFIDAKRQAAGGGSYGGHLANWMQATTSHYKCLISHAGLVNTVSQWGTSDYIYGREVMNGGTPWADSAATWQAQNPITMAENFKTPMLITIGEQDFRVPLNNSIENWHIHQRLKVPSKLIVFPEENHWINKGENSRFFYAEVAGWLKKWL
jgi:dipeptidyl aminopeptidase/acylaminoacyl peptidase